MLPNSALLRIFDFSVAYDMDEATSAEIEAWQTLVHVCRKWRKIVFGPPCRLDLRLYCGARAPVRKMLKIWPAFPIVIEAYNEYVIVRDILAALKHSDRIHELRLWRVPGSQLERILDEMYKPFPALTHLTLEPGDETVPVVYDSILGGSVSRLQSLRLYQISFPTLPSLLLSAIHLVELSLSGIPHSGYISPEEMVSALSALTRLKNLYVGFKSTRSRPDRESQCPPPPTRALLPVLTELHFRGVAEYLEDLVAGIDAPLLNDLEIAFFHQLTFETPQLAQFIRRTPKFKANNDSEGHAVFSDSDVSVTLPQTFDGSITLKVLPSQSVFISGEDLQLIMTCAEFSGYF
jgi:hypothetical protein